MTTTSPVEILDEVQLQRRLEDLIREIQRSTDLASFERRAERYELDGREAALFDELRSLRFLLGDG